MAVFNPESTTVKTRQALAHAQAMAKQLGHPEVNTLHLLLSAAQQDGGLTRPLLERAGVHGAALQRAITSAFSQMPQVSGGDLRPSRELGEALELAAAEAEALHDRYVSTEHLILGFQSPQASRKGVKAAAVLAELPVGRHRGSRGPLRGARQVHPEPHRAGQVGPARPGHRPRRRNPPLDPGPLAPDEEQPGADR